MAITALSAIDSPTLITPALGTPSAIILTNASGLPLSGLSGLGTGVATLLGTPTLANLNAAISDADMAILAANTFTAGQTIATGIVTASIPILSATQTWNNAAVTFTAIKAAITDTASAVASLLLDLQVGGVSKFSVSKNSYVNYDGDGYQVRMTMGGTNQIFGLDVYSGVHFALASHTILGWANNTVGNYANNQDVLLARASAKGLVLNAVDGAPTATDPLMDFQVSGASKFAVTKAGGLRMLDAANAATTTIKAAAGVSVTGGTNRDLTFLTGNAARTVTFTGDVTLPQAGGSGTTIGQVIALARGIVRY